MCSGPTSGRALSGVGWPGPSPDKPSSVNQRFFLTDKGRDHLRTPGVHESVKARQ